MSARQQIEANRQTGGSSERSYGSTDGGEARRVESSGVNLRSVFAEDGMEYNTVDLSAVS